MSAGFGALRDQHICAGLDRLLRHLLALNLADEESTGVSDRLRKRFGITKRKHNGAWFCRQCNIEQLRLLGEAPRDEPDAKGRSGAGEALGEISNLLAQPRLISVAAPKNAEAPCDANSRS